MTPRYRIVDVQTGEEFAYGSNYNGMAKLFFDIEDDLYGGNAEYLTMVDTNTGRATSVVYDPEKN